MEWRRPPAGLGGCRLGAAALAAGSVAASAVGPGRGGSRERDAGTTGAGLWPAGGHRATAGRRGGTERGRGRAGAGAAPPPRLGACAWQDRGSRPAGRSGRGGSAGVAPAAGLPARVAGALSP